MYIGPNIATNGLVLALDAANPRSYPGTGTTWYDLSGNGHNATLVNGPGFNSDNKGNISFDGSNQYASFSNPLNQVAIDAVWTVQCWIRITTAPAQTLIGGLHNAVYIEYVQGNNSLLYLNAGANDYYTYGGSFTTGNWEFATFRFNNATGDREIWKNLTDISTSGPNNTSTPTGQNSTFTLSSSSNAINGNVSCLFIYNRYLSSSEIENNYDTLKKRFGL